MTRGLFITFEGGEGAGKSTQIRRLARKLREKGYSHIVTREPGGSPGAEAIRHVLLSGAAEPFGPGMEAVLFAAARADHVDRLIRPALERGDIVLCDRFIDSTRVYQGDAGEVDPATVDLLEKLAIGDVRPDITLVFDIDPVVGMMRARDRRGDADADRFEKETLEVQERRRAAFLDIAEREPDRCIVIDAGVDADTVESVVTAAVFAALEARAREKAPRREGAA